MIDFPRWLTLVVFVGAILGAIWYGVAFATHRRPNYIALTLLLVVVSIGEATNLLKPGTLSSLLSDLVAFLPGGALVRTIARVFMSALPLVLAIIFMRYPAAVFRGRDTRRK